MTTIVLIRKNNDVVVASDGQVSMGNTVIKSNANKVRKIEKRNVIAGFAGSTADALTLFERLEAKLEKHAGNLTRAAVEPAKPAITFRFSILRTLLALLFITVFPILTWPSLATTTSFFFLTNTIVVMRYRWIRISILQVAN